MGAETYLTFLNKLEELFQFYFESRNINSIDALVDDMVKLQFVETLIPGVRSFVEARTPASAKMAAEAANLLFETNSVDFRANCKWDHKLKNNGFENLIDSDKPRNDAPKFHENRNSLSESKTVRCFLCHALAIERHNIHRTKLTIQMLK